MYFKKSSENVENVVKPPNIPVIMNNINEFFVSSAYEQVESHPKSKPIKNEPVTFIINVDKGAYELLKYLNNSEIKNLIMAPIEPPIATNAIFDIIMFYLIC